MDTKKDRFPHLPDMIAGLGELAYNLWWSWHPAARKAMESFFVRRRTITW